jgi:uncharacterized membrane protein YqjE
MQGSAHWRTNLVGLGLMILSSLTMIWMFWHYPRGTGIATLVVLTAFGISARLSKWIDSEGLGSDSR